MPVATLEDKEIRVEEIPQSERNIHGCISVDNFIVTIRKKNLTLYDEDFDCIGDINYKVLYPSSICSRGYDIVVSFKRITKKELGNVKKWPKFFDVQTYKLVPPGCATIAKLTKSDAFNTEGECFSTAVCPLYDKNLTIAAGMRLDTHPERDDINFQVQIIKSNGKVLKTLNLNQMGEPCFTTEFFLCATMKFEEIVVSEAKLRRVRGVNMKTGKTLFEFEGGSPQGLAYDKEDNIYVYNDSAFYWIAPLRQKIHYMQQGYKKSGRRDDRLANAICYNDSKQLLYLTNIDKSIIETYQIV